MSSFDSIIFARSASADAASAAGAASVERGQKFFATNFGKTLGFSCASCHGEQPTRSGRDQVTEKPIAPVPYTEEPKLSLLEQGNRLASSGQLQEAIQTYEKARRANPGNADVYYLLGSAYHRTGDLAKALEAYRQCTSGNYAGVAANHVRNLEKKLSKTPKSQAFTP